MKVIASSFADIQDLADYKRSGKLSDGDNGIGCWGDQTAQDVVPMCALPQDVIVEHCGSGKAKDARRKPVRVRANEREVVCLLADTMPHTKDITNGAGIDLNPAAAKVLGLNPPFMVDADWEWIET